MDISLRRESALAMEIHETGQWPGMENLSKWQISEREILGKYQDFETGGGSEGVQKVVQEGGVKC